MRNGGAILYVRDSGALQAVAPRFTVTKSPAGATRKARIYVKGHHSCVNGWLVMNHRDMAACPVAILERAQAMLRPHESTTFEKMGATMIREQHAANPHVDDQCVVTCPMFTWAAVAKQQMSTGCCTKKSGCQKTLCVREASRH
jgi:hypothetical protein